MSDNRRWIIFSSLEFFITLHSVADRMSSVWRMHVPLISFHLNLLFFTRCQEKKLMTLLENEMSSVNLKVIVF